MKRKEERGGVELLVGCWLSYYIIFYEVKGAREWVCKKKRKETGD
mgnify:CR=1 FL=1